MENPLQKLLFWTLVGLPTCAALGGEKAFFTTPAMAPDAMHRQNVCDRYDLVRNGTLTMANALQDMQLHVLVANYGGAFFNYNDGDGIDPEYPGLVPIILDELARRGKFTWRESFGISGDPSDYNTTWTDMLLWGIETYDISADWWSQNLERMTKGSVLLNEWYDNSIILISKQEPLEVSHEINYWNWTRPYDGAVWITTILTVMVSGMVYQVLEWFAEDRKERPFFEWWQQNQYLSAINFTQNYEYQPKTFSTRLFGVSMAVWALVMTATYTANLASLLVERKPPKIIASSIEEVSVFGQRVCTWESTASDLHIKATYPQIERVPKATLKDMYDGLHTGECDFLLETVASWEKYKAVRAYNPQCDLFWVGTDRKIKDSGAGFTAKADSGEYCTGLIRDVLDLHMHNMIENDFIQQAWERDFKTSHDIDCLIYSQTMANLGAGNNQTNRRLMLRASSQKCDDGQVEHARSQRRRLATSKGGAAGAAAAAAADDYERQRLTLDQMIGTFVLHWGLMLIAMCTAAGHELYKKYVKAHPTTRFGVDRGDMKQMEAPPTDKPYSQGSRSTKRTEAASCFDDFDDFDSSHGPTIKPREAQMDLPKQVAALRLSQAQMKEFQQEMLVEQRCLKRQIEVLLHVVSQGQFNDSIAHSTSFHRSGSLLSGDLDSFAEKLTS